MSNNGPDLRNVLWYNQLGMHDVDRVGGKNASLGEMITNLSDLGVAVPNGFATPHRRLTISSNKAVLTSASISYWIRPTLTTLHNWPRPAPRSANG